MSEMNIEHGGRSPRLRRRLCRWAPPSGARLIPSPAASPPDDAGKPPLSALIAGSSLLKPTYKIMKAGLRTLTKKTRPGT